MLYDISLKGKLLVVVVVVVVPDVAAGSWSVLACGVWWRGV
jgi:hypothetical protein